MKTDESKSNILSVGNDCTGCRVCELVCPRRCICMEQNDEGFLYPVVNDRECISCGLCLKKCAQSKHSNIKHSQKGVYAVKNKDKSDLKHSTSGGIADVAAKVILSKGGIIFGAAYDDELTVRHIVVENECDRGKLRSSKYVQSDLGDCFERVKTELNSGRKVLFTGTPCQINSLYVFLGTEYENLYTIDLVCHGVPSPIMFKKYIDYIGRILGETVLFYDFRSKEKKGWGTQYLIKIKTKNKTKTQIMSLDPYGYHFLQGDCYRECCYKCRYANLNRPGDLTLGDFWGVEKYYPKFFSSKGVSEVLVNSDKGIYLFEEMKSYTEYIPIRIDEVLLKNGNLKNPTNRPDRRNTIYSNLKSDTFIEELEVPFQWKVRIKNILPRKVINYLKRYIS